MMFAQVLHTMKIAKILISYYLFIMMAGKYECLNSCLAETEFAYDETTQRILNVQNRILPL